MKIEDIMINFLGEKYCSVSARSMLVQSDMNQTMSFGDVATEWKRKPVYGFCESPECIDFSKNNIYKVDGKYRVKVTEKTNLELCPSCELTLYYASNYKRVFKSEKEKEKTRKRKNNVLL